ncbi:hypothetical protein AHAS_Ahas15G0212200 [Arachis hypogaea]
MLLPNDVKRAINTRILELGMDFVDRDLGRVNTSWVREFYCNFFRATLHSVQLWGREIMIAEAVIGEALQCQPPRDCHTGRSLGDGFWEQEAQGDAFHISVEGG